MTAPPLPPQVAAAFAAFPPDARARLMAVRALLFDLAASHGAAPLTETLKWGEPAYLTEATKSGTTVRLGLVGGASAVLLNCRTTLVDGFRADFPDAFLYSGTRALIVQGPPAPPLDICLTRALTYHRSKRTRP